jgi:hypothetical protein
MYAKRICRGLALVMDGDSWLGRLFTFEEHRIVERRERRHLGMHARHSDSCSSRSSLLAHIRIAAKTVRPHDAVLPDFICRASWPVNKLCFPRWQFASLFVSMASAQVLDSSS